MSISQNINKKYDEGNVQRIHVQATVEYPSTLIHMKPKFKTIKDWLFKICDGKTPTKPIKEFILECSKSSIHGYILRLYGVNDYANKTNGFDIKIDYEPNSSNMYFIPAKATYQNLSYHQFKKKITEQIKKALNTKKIKTSFLAEANYIYLPFSDEKIILK